MSCGKIGLVSFVLLLILSPFNMPSIQALLLLLSVICLGIAFGKYIVGKVVILGGKPSDDKLHFIDVSGYRKWIEDVPIVGITMDGRVTKAKLFVRLFEKGAATLVLRREADNPVDPNAVMVLGVWNGHAHHLGYVPKELAEIVSRVIDSGRICVARLDKILEPPPGKPNPGFRFSIWAHPATISSSNKR